MEDAVLNGDFDGFNHRMMAMLKELLYLHIYYAVSYTHLVNPL